MAGGLPLTAGRRAIIHLDLDAFYASVEQLRHPELRGRPVIVGGAGGGSAARAVVSAASYEARPFGVRSAMPLATALRLCPRAIVVPVDFAACRAASAAVFAIAHRFTPIVQPLSLDEAFLDVTGSERRFGRAPAIAAAIRDLILAECGLHASFGVATCRVVAKVASDREKPRGFVVVQPGDEARFLAPLPLRALPGLGPAAERAIGDLGARTLGDLARLPPDAVTGRLGKGARLLWERAQGIDASAVTVPGPPKSISREETFARDVTDPARLEARLRRLAADVARRLRAEGRSARTVTVRIRDQSFRTIGRQRSLPSPVCDDRTITATALDLHRAADSGKPVRLLGVRVSGLEEPVQRDMLAGGGSADLDHVLDGLRGRFGAAAIRWGAGSGEELRDLDFRGEDLRHPSSSSR